MVTGRGKMPSRRLKSVAESGLLPKDAEAHGARLAPRSLRRLWRWVSKASREKPSRRTLDRLALLAGFQDWDDLRTALRGTNDAGLNYKD